MYAAGASDGGLDGCVGKEDVRGVEGRKVLSVPVQNDFYFKQMFDESTILGFRKNRCPESGENALGVRGHRSEKIILLVLNRRIQNQSGGREEHYIVMAAVTTRAVWSTFHSDHRMWLLHDDAYREVV